MRELKEFIIKDDDFKDCYNSYNNNLYSSFEKSIDDLIMDLDEDFKLDLITLDLIHYSTSSFKSKDGTIYDLDTIYDIYSNSLL